MTNATGTALDVGVLVAPQSARAMTAAAAPSLVAPGQATTITASLSAPDPGDAPRARVNDADGVVVADLALSLSGDGTWKANLRLPIPVPTSS